MVAGWLPTGLPDGERPSLTLEHHLILAPEIILAPGHSAPENIHAPQITCTVFRGAHTGPEGTLASEITYSAIVYQTVVSIS